MVWFLLRPISTDSGTRFLIVFGPGLMRMFSPRNSLVVARNLWLILFSKI
jgi:hypothetical protein